MFKKILVPTDGSNSSKAAFKRAVDLAKITDAEIVLFHASFSPEGVWGKSPAQGISLAVDQLSAAGSAVLRETLQESDIGDITISEVVEAGKPAQKIVKYINGNNVDLVVMGSVGHGAFSGALLGSVSQKVLSGSRAPVMVVKDVENQSYVLEIYG